MAHGAYTSGGSSSTNRFSLLQKTDAAEHDTDSTMTGDPTSSYDETTRSTPLPQRYLQSRGGRFLNRGIRQPSGQYARSRRFHETGSNSRSPSRPQPGSGIYTVKDVKDEIDSVMETPIEETDSTATTDETVMAVRSSGGDEGLPSFDQDVDDEEPFFADSDDSMRAVGHESDNDDFLFPRKAPPVPQVFEHDSPATWGESFTLDMFNSLPYSKARFPTSHRANDRKRAKAVQTSSGIKGSRVTKDRELTDALKSFTFYTEADVDNVLQKVKEKKLHKRTKSQLKRERMAAIADWIPQAGVVGAEHPESNALRELRGSGTWKFGEGEDL